MKRQSEYREHLLSLQDWTPFLLKNSGLPGPRGNLELAAAVADLASPEQVLAWLSIPAAQAPENTAAVFLVFCGITALGKQIAKGAHEHLARLRLCADDERWRVREAVAVALQYVGDEDMPLLLKTARTWSKGNWYEQRAAAAALAEPRLLHEPSAAKAALRILDTITAGISRARDRRDPSFKALRQSMGYCWSVVVAALPDLGKPLMGNWMVCSDADVRWIMRENLKKGRLSRLDPIWTAKWARNLAKSK